MNVKGPVRLQSLCIPSLLALSGIVLFACANGSVSSSSGGGPESQNGNGTSNGNADGGRVVTPGTHFESSESAFDVPAGDGSWEGGFYAAAADLWVTMDMDGDGKPDLVNTGRYVNGDAATWGSDSTPSWKVYKNNGSAFDKTATTWAVPKGDTSWTGGYYSAASDLWITLDMDGDGKPDLVNTGHYVSGNASVWGTSSAPSWKVYKNTGSGFELTAATWTIPVAEGSSTGGYYTATSDLWATVDMDGDGKPDLVSTGHYVSGEAAVWGTESAPSWKVYKNDGKGFATTAATWTVPKADASWKGGFYRVASDLWVMMDMDGDKKPEFVNTGHYVAGDATAWGTESAPSWKVYKNNGKSFETNEASWGVPKAEASWKGGYYRASGDLWTTMDLDGDGRPDLVSTGHYVNGDVAVWGSELLPVWKFYKNDGSKFSPTSVDWAVPRADTSWKGGYYRTSGDLWSTLDLDGDGRVDLVSTAHYVNGDVAVWGDANPAWKLYRNMP
ncbi:MAG: VCBS repeat-containing protein [Polyangiaceae bacterium]